jgi:predicted nucleotidyltransferase
VESSTQVKSVEDLAQIFSADWSFLLKGREASEQKVRAIEKACRPFMMPDTSLVVFGSLARQEFTPESDVDWTLLVDGFTVPEHLRVARDIEDALARLESKKPGRTGTFGNLASSHNLIHYIGGEDDTNANTTRRSLLMLESRAVGQSEAFDRVRHNLLRRYLEEDLGLWRETTVIKVPHFLLNDFARYWRMMTVDFADKQHDRFHDGFALRNIKLRVSRKLIYIAGLLSCFRCQLRFPDEAERIIFFKKGNELAVADLVLSALDRTPLDLAAATLYEVLGKVESVREFFSAYNDFLGILNNPEKRDTLEKLTPDRLESDPTYAEARAVSRRFNNAVHSIFLERSNTIGELTIRYGIF